VSGLVAVGCHASAVTAGSTSITGTNRTPGRLKTGSTQAAAVRPLDLELTALRATSPELVRTSLDAVPGPRPDTLGALYADPAAGLERLADMSESPNIPTVVLVHGGFTDASFWDPVIKDLQARDLPVLSTLPASRLTTGSSPLSSGMSRISCCRTPYPFHSPFGVGSG
jgi:pimeloyl-ACP methyl ester carboxylesterase